MSTVFTGVLISFALILVTYHGTEEKSKGLSENLLTNLGGVFALLVALVPTKFQGTTLPSTFYTHQDAVRGWIHNGSAVLFLLLMGIVVLTKFAKAPYYRMYYIITGNLVMIGLGIAIISFALETDTGIFWGETLALWAFGAAWLRRGVPKK
jgi:hypothetical protein